MNGRSSRLEFQPVAGYIQQVLFIKEPASFPLFHLVDFFKMLDGFLGAVILRPVIFTRTNTIWNINQNHYEIVFISISMIYFKNSIQGMVAGINWARDPRWFQGICKRAVNIPSVRTCAEDAMQKIYVYLCKSPLH